MPQTLGEKLRALREERNLKLVRVAETVLGAKKRQPEVSYWEAEIFQPFLENLISLVQLYSVSVDLLLGVVSSIETQHEASAKPTKEQARSESPGHLRTKE